MKKAKFVSLFLVLALLGSLLAVGVSADEAVDPVLSLWALGHDQGYQTMEKVDDGVKFTELQIPAGVASNAYVNWVGIEDGYVDFSKPVTMSFTINELSVPVADADNSYGFQTVPAFMIIAGNDRSITLNISKTSNTGNAYIYTGASVARQADGNALYTQCWQALDNLYGTYYIEFDIPNLKVLFGTSPDRSTWVNLYPSDDAYIETMTVPGATTLAEKKAILSFANDEYNMYQFATRTNFTPDAEARGKWVYTVHEFNGTKMTEPTITLAEGAQNITMTGTSITLDANYEKKTLADLKALLTLPEGFEVTFLNGATALTDTDELGETTTIMIANGDMEVPLYVVSLEKAFGTDVPAPGDDEDDNKDDTTPGDEDDKDTTDDKDDDKDDEKEELPPATGVSVSVAAVLLAGASAGVLGLTSKKNKK